MKLKFFVSYKCHDYSRAPFLDTMKLFLMRYEKQKTHIIAGHINANIPKTDSQEFLCTVVEYEHLPYFHGIIINCSFIKISENFCKSSTSHSLSLPFINSEPVILTTSYSVKVS